MMRELVLFYIWWLLVNGIMYYGVYDFLLFAAESYGKKYRALWLVVGGCLTLISLSSGVFGMFFFYILALILFAKLTLKLSWKQLVVPVAIILTLHTLTEGFEVLILAFLSTNFRAPFYGAAVQAFVSLFFALLFFLVLIVIRKKHSRVLRCPIASYLYILLLPCSFLVLLLRWGLRLDSPVFAEYFLSFKTGTNLLLLFTMLIAVAFFFIIIEVFSKILLLTHQQHTSLFLSQQIEGQKIYIEEAKKRNEAYAAFQHDLDNHLLILSGLLEKNRYAEARDYGQKLHKACVPLNVSVSTGNAALDILLREKLSYANQRGIDTACRVHIQDNCYVEDLDLCIIFSNILDNAICACIKEEYEHPFLSISTKTRYRLLLIECLNTVSVLPCHQPVRAGIGLNNIKNIAEKYQGAVEWEHTGEIFRISVLLCSASNPTTKGR